LSADLITFHQAVSQLQLMEDDLLETHKQVVDDTRHWLEMDTCLLDHTAAVDYDQEGEHISLDRALPTLMVVLVLLLFPVMLATFLLVDSLPK
jgi:kinesin family protein 2/24